mmetsp:Transcript_47123/g.64172  ORF Transcript_47123/g.64172 Transcript_47123/m.64172 type:complete len:93 (+) Transcript_47123:2338-2616(+)
MQSYTFIRGHMQILTNDIWKADMMLMKNRKKKVFLKPFSIEENRAHTYLSKKIMQRVSYVVLQQHDNISTNGIVGVTKKTKKVVDTMRQRGS